MALTRETKLMGQIGGIGMGGVVYLLIFGAPSGIDTSTTATLLILITALVISRYYTMAMRDLAGEPRRLAARTTRPVGKAQLQEPARDPAMKAVLEARQRRAEARRIVEQDPLLAVELKIGRPDLGRTFNDGGLVDLNGAPAPVIAQVCGIDLSLAERIVEGRSSLGAFQAVDDVFSVTDLPVNMWNRIRDRAVVINA